MVVALLSAAGAFYLTQTGKGAPEGRKAGAPGAKTPASAITTVKTARPRQGGLARVSDQPGTIRGFEYAPLYSKVTGYLKELKVDRGDRVHKGQLLAVVYDPELDVAVLQAEAELAHSEAEAKQAEARLKTAEAGVQGALAKQRQSTSVLEEAVAQRTYRKKALDRLTQLAGRNAVEQQLVDEAEDQYMASLASEHAAQSGILTAEAQLLEAKAAVDLAQADLKTAQAEIAVSAAQVKKAKVFLDYTKIEAPFDGVITTRGDAVHRGAFIHAATDVRDPPLLTVSRTDKFRTIVEIPDDDAPFCDVGDPATVRVNSLAGRVFSGKVSRTSEAEELKTRTMRVEIDLPNPSGLLRDGMYGRALIELEPPSQHMVIPATCLIEQNGKGEGAVFVVRDGKARRLPVKVGKDSGLLVEVVSGLDADDQVITEITPAISDGTPVRAEPAGGEKKESAG